MLQFSSGQNNHKQVFGATPSDRLIAFSDCQQIPVTMTQFHGENVFFPRDWKFPGGA